MTTNRFWCNNALRGILVVVILISLFAASCTAEPQTTTLTSTTGPTATLALTATETEVPTAAAITPTPIATLDPKLELIRNASESISRFETYDDFSGSFDESKWIVTTSNTPNSFSWSNVAGSLAVHLGNRLYKNVENLFLEVNPEVFSDNTNGVSALFQPTTVREQSSYGVKIDLTDDQSHWMLMCLRKLELPTLKCELYNAATDALLQRSIESQFSLAADLKLDLEWIPESGLLMVFVDNQLYFSVDLENAGPLKIEDAGIFVKRSALSEGGDLMFADFRIGTYQETGMTLPDDLFALQQRPYQFTQDGIDYYLLDDFEDASFDGTLDRSRWAIDYYGCSNEEDCIDDRSGEQYQADGRMLLLGEYKGINPRAVDHLIRAIQFDVIGSGETLPNSTLHIFFMVAHAHVIAGRDGAGEEVFSFACEIRTDNEGYGRIQCIYNGSTGKSNFPPVIFPRTDVNTINLAYNETLEVFELRVNGILAAQLPVSDYDADLINELYSSFRFEEDWQSLNQRMILDNVLIGYKSDEAYAAPESETPAIISALPHSDLFLYDDFENIQFDGAWDVSKWPFSAVGDDIGLWQKDGALVVGEKLSDEQVPANSMSSQLSLLSTDESINAVQIEIAPYDQQDGERSVLTLVASQLEHELESNSNGCTECANIQFGCSIGFLGDHEDLNCFHMRQSYHLTEYPRTKLIEIQNIDSSLTHFLSIELDHPNRTYYVYLDGEMLVSYRVPYEYLLGEQTYIMAPFYPGRNAVKARVESVLLGREADHPELVEEMQFEVYSPMNGFEKGDAVISLPARLETNYLIQANLPDSFKLSEINSIGFSIEPVDAPPLGWNTSLVFSSAGSDGFHFGCILEYQRDTESLLHCEWFEQGNSDQQLSLFSGDIPFNPETAHTLSMQIDPDTGLITIMLDGDPAFEVDILKSASYLEETTFSFELHVKMEDAQTDDFRIRLKDLNYSYSN